MSIESSFHKEPQINPPEADNTEAILLSDMRSEVQESPLIRFTEQLIWTKLSKERGIKKMSKSGLEKLVKKLSWEDCSQIFNNLKFLSPDQITGNALYVLTKYMQTTFKTALTPAQKGMILFRSNTHYILNNKETAELLTSLSEKNEIDSLAWALTSNLIYSGYVGSIAHSNFRTEDYPQPVAKIIETFVDFFYLNKSTTTELDQHIARNGVGANRDVVLTNLKMLYKSLKTEKGKPELDRIYKKLNNIIADPKTSKSDKDDLLFIIQ